MPRMPLSETSAKWAPLVVCLVFAFVWMFNAYKLGKLKINLSYRSQLIVTVVIVLFANLLSTVLHHWIFHSIGFVLCGFLWLIHPVMIKGTEPSEKNLRLVRLAGILLILIGLFSRVHY